MVLSHRDDSILIRIETIGFKEAADGVELEDS